MSKSSRRLRSDPLTQAQEATVNQILILQDSCALFDAGRDHQFINMAGSLRALCHEGSSGSLLNSVREKGRTLPSSVQRVLTDMDNAASDHFWVAQVRGGQKIIPRLELSRSSTKSKKVKRWWSEIVITDEQKRGLSRGGIVLTVANSEGAAHFTLDIDELYDDLARCNRLGLWAGDWGSWRTFGLAPIQATVRQIAHEFLLGMEDWIKARRPDWTYVPSVSQVSGFAIAPGIQLGIEPASAGT
jgi:hypothetical protein